MGKTVDSKIDLAKTIINVVKAFNDIKLSDTEVMLMSYFMVYGISPQTKQLIIQSKICKNIGTIKTIMVKLKKLGLIYKDDLNGKVYINNNLKFSLTPSIGIYLKIDS